MKVWYVGMLPRDRTVRVDRSGNEISSKIEADSVGDGKQQVMMFIGALIYTEIFSSGRGHLKRKELTCTSFHFIHWLKHGVWHNGSLVDCYGSL